MLREHLSIIPVAGIHAEITNNLQLSEFSLRCKEVLVSYKDELKALKKAKKIV